MYPIGQSREAACNQTVCHSHQNYPVSLCGQVISRINLYLFMDEGLISDNIQSLPQKLFGVTTIQIYHTNVQADTHIPLSHPFSHLHGVINHWNISFERTVYSTWQHQKLQPFTVLNNLLPVLLQLHINEHLSLHVYHQYKTHYCYTTLEYFV